MRSVHASLFRPLTPAEAELDRLRIELATLRKTLHERELALGDLRGQLISFEGRYLRQVGTLLKQLDEWEQKRAELHAKPEENIEPEPDDLPDPATKQTSPMQPVDLRALFRELAKRIHPDFALDAADEQRRTRLMAQANEAFRREDAGILQRMLDGFDPATGLTTQNAIQAELTRVHQLLQQVRHDIATVEQETLELHASDSAQLQRRVIEAAQNGRDLLAEMAARIKGQIGLAMRQYELDLDRIKRPPRGLNVETLLSVETPQPTQPRYDARRRTWIR